MIPTHILVGLVVGGVVTHQRLGPLAGVCAAVALLWGVGVGLNAGSQATFVGGAVLAAANLAVGAIVGAGVQKLFRALLRRGAQSLNR
jgi:hypothetical protein